MIGSVVVPLSLLGSMLMECPQKKRKLSTEEAAAQDTPSSPSTVTETVAARRLQYKLYQRRHRAKRKAYTEQLGHEVQQLREEVKALESQLQSAVRALPRSAHFGAAEQVVVSLFQVFEHGYDPQRGAAQEEFLHSIADHRISGPQFTGINEFIDQWKRCAQVFDTMHLAVRKTTTEQLEETSVVKVRLRVTVHATQCGTRHLFPATATDDELREDLVRTPLQFDTSMELMVNTTNQITWCGAEVDMMSGLQAALGSFRRVCAAVEGANISLSTGHIAPLPDSFEDSASAARTHDLSLLLS